MLKPITIWSVISAVFLRKWGWIVNALWGVVGVLGYVNDHKDMLSPRLKGLWEWFYVLPSFGWRTWVMIALIILVVSSVQGAYSFARGYSKRFEELTKRKLMFQVDEKRSLAYVDQPVGDFPLIQVALLVQFKNQDDLPQIMEDLNFEVYENCDDGSQERVPTFIYGEPMFSQWPQGQTEEFRGRSFDRGVSGWFRFYACVAIIIKEMDQSDLIGSRHYLRITLEAMNQVPLSASLYFDWPTAIEKPTRCFLVLPRSLAAPRRDHIMTYDKGDELKKLSEGFALAAPASDKPD
jgi:hypothetical protein